MIGSARVLCRFGDADIDICASGAEDFLWRDTKFWSHGWHAVHQGRHIARGQDRRHEDARRNMPILPIKRIAQIQEIGNVNVDNWRRRRETVQDAGVSSGVSRLTRKPTSSKPICTGSGCSW